MASQEAPPLNRRTKLAYGAGAMAFGVKDTGFQTFLMIFYNQVIGVPPQAVGVAIMTALVLEAMLDPIIGYWSDHTRSRWGRRHPFMYVAAVPAAVCYFFLWHPPGFVAPEHMAFYIAGAVILVRIFISLFEIPSTALLAELTDRYDERTGLMSLRLFFSFMAGLALSGLTLVVFLRPTTEYPVGQLNRDGYSAYAIVSALLILAAILISALGTRNRIPWLRKPAPAVRKTKREIFVEVRDTLNEPSFLAVLFAGLFSSIAVGLSGGLAIYLNTYFWEFTTQQISILLLPAVVGVALAMVVAPYSSKRFGKKASAIGMLALCTVSVSAPFALRLLGLFPENGSTALLGALLVIGPTSVITMTMAIGCIVMLGSMIADVVEESELKTGRRSEGLFFSAQAFVAKAVTGLGLFLSGLILAAVHFPQNAKPGAVDPQIIQNLALWYVPVVLLSYGLGIACLCAYRIDRGVHEENLRRLQTLRAEA